jgi:hypothetical protein
MTGGVNVVNLKPYKITLQRPKGLLFDPLIWTIIVPFVVDM